MIIDHLSSAAEDLHDAIINASSVVELGIRHERALRTLGQEFCRRAIRGEIELENAGLLPDPGDCTIAFAVWVHYGTVAVKALIGKETPVSTASLEELRAVARWTAQAIDQSIESRRK